MALFRRRVTAEEGLEAVRRELLAPGSKLRDELSVLLLPKMDVLREETLLAGPLPEADARTFVEMIARHAGGSRFWIKLPAAP